MRVLSEAPPDFVSYVDGRLPVVESAAQRLSGDDLQAERLAQDLLTLVALRWRRLAKADAKNTLEPGDSADLYLTRLFRQEAFDQGAPQVPLRLDVPVPLRRRHRGGRLSLADEAGLIWERARRTIRRRLLIAAGAGGLLAVVALCQRGGGGETASSSGQQDLRPTAPPPGADVAPASPGPAVTVAGVPPQIEPPGGDLPLLSADPVRRATVLMALGRADTSPIVVQGDDGRWRRINVAPALAAPFLHAGALSPDGLWAAFGASTGTTVVNLTTGQAQIYNPASPAASSTRPVWLGPRHLLLWAKSLLDVGTGQLGAAPAAPEDVVTPQHFDPAGDPATRLIELLSVGEPATAAARVRRWSREGSELVTQVNGPLADLIGPWRGGGFGYGGEDGLLARACLPASAPDGGSAAMVVAVVRPKTARVERALLIAHAQSGGVRVIGWADEKRLLLSLVAQGSQRVVTWDVVAGGVNLVSTIRGDGVLAFPDLTRVA
jgi:hypothetical protein